MSQRVCIQMKVLHIPAYDADWKRVRLHRTHRNAETESFAQLPTAIKKGCGKHPPPTAVSDKQDCGQTCVQQHKRYQCQRKESQAGCNLCRNVRQQCQRQSGQQQEQQTDSLKYTHCWLSASTTHQAALWSASSLPT